MHRWGVVAVIEHGQVVVEGRLSWATFYRVRLGLTLVLMLAGDSGIFGWV